MATISVAYTDKGIIILSVIDSETGTAIDAPLLPAESFDLGRNLIKAADAVNPAPSARILLPGGPSSWHLTPRSGKTLRLGCTISEAT